MATGNKVAGEELAETGLESCPGQAHFQADLIHGALVAQFGASITKGTKTYHPEGGHGLERLGPYYTMRRTSMN